MIDAMPRLTRRQFFRDAGLAGGMAALPWFPAWAQPVSAGIATPLPSVSGTDIALTVAHQMTTIDGKPLHTIGVNGTVPGPLIRLRQGQTARLTVNNNSRKQLHQNGKTKFRKSATIKLLSGRSLAYLIFLKERFRRCLP